MTEPPHADTPRAPTGPAFPPSDSDADAREASRLRLLARPVIMVLALGAGAVLMREFPAATAMLESPATLRNGVSGRVLFLACGMLWCTFGLPRQILCFAGGVAFGVWEGTVLSSSATVLGCLAGFGWARWGAQAWAARWLADRRAGAVGVRARIVRMDDTIRAHPFAAILTLRLLPVGSSLLLNLLAGVSGAAVVPFAAASALGSLPQTFVFVLLGSGAHIGGNGRIVIGALLFAASGGVGLWLLRRVGMNDAPLRGPPTPDTETGGGRRN